MEQQQLEIRAVVSQKSLVGPVSWVTLSNYPSKGYTYYRLQWGVGEESLGYCHIPGGNRGRVTAQSRAKKVARWIRENRSRSEIMRNINRWKKDAAVAAANSRAQQDRALQLQLFA